MQDIDWNKLKPYSGDNKKSFEELCYQIVSEEYKNAIIAGAILTSIDDSGGGDGVEFYITFPNGDVHGWQAKFFDRLNEGGRKEQIKQSLQTTYKKHPNLKKWFLCSKSNFTPEEKIWFEDNLAESSKHGESVLPTGNNVQLFHWGISDFLVFLKKYPNIHNFFFSEKLLTQEWFVDKYKIDVERSQIKEKYEAGLHISTDVDDAINKVLGGVKLAELLDREIENLQVIMYAEEYKNKFSDIFSKNIKKEYNQILSELIRFLYDKSGIIDEGIHRLEVLKRLILEKNELTLKLKIREFEEYISSLWDFYHEYDKLSDSELYEPLRYLRTDNEEDIQSDTEKEMRKSQ